MIEVLVPFPPADLSPNKRLHWAKKARAVKTYRELCAAHGWEAGLRPMKADKLNVSITFTPPDKRRRDRDNMIAAFKAGADGIADVIQVDDADWVPTYHVTEPEKGGAVSVKIEVAQ